MPASTIVRLISSLQSDHARVQWLVAAGSGAWRRRQEAPPSAPWGSRSPALRLPVSDGGLGLGGGGLSLVARLLHAPRVPPLAVRGGAAVQNIVPAPGRADGQPGKLGRGSHCGAGRQQAGVVEHSAQVGGTRQPLRQRAGQRSAAHMWPGCALPKRGLLRLKYGSTCRWKNAELRPVRSEA